MLDVETQAEPGTAASTHSFSKGGTRIEAWAVVAISLLMVLFPTVETILRRFHVALPGSAEYTRHLTLWIGFIGALIATATEKHLALSTIDLLPEGRPRIAARIYGHFVSAAVSAILGYASLKLVLVSRASIDTLPGGIPKWWSELIMPAALAVMAVRFALKSPGGRAAVIGCLLPVAFVIVVGVLEATKVLGPEAGASFVSAHPRVFTLPGSLLLMGAFLLGAPVFIVMAGFAMLFFFAGGTPIAAVPTEALRLAREPQLPAIPLLTIAGYVLAEGGASQRLVRAAQALFGWMPGGLAVMSVFVCAIFTTFTGASGVTILALGGILLPSLIREGYPEGFSLGLVTAAGSLGLLFPPSLAVILYGVVAEVPIDRLYIGGLFPGLLMILVVAAYSVIIGVRARAPRQSFQVREAASAIWGAKWDLGLPLLVIVTVATGIATIVEAAALGAAYAIIVELAVFRDIHPIRDLPRVLLHAATLVSSVIILLGMALGLTNYLVDAEIPTMLLGWVQTHIKSQWAFLLALNVILLVLGSVLEIYSAIVVLAPLIKPLAAAFHVEPVHLGVVFLTNMQLGFLLPPMGLNLFLSASRFQKPLPMLYRKTLPFLIIMSIGVLLVTYLDVFTTGVVRAIKG